jgi:hypothetical protein
MGKRIVEAFTRSTAMNIHWSYTVGVTSVTGTKYRTAYKRKGVTRVPAASEAGHREREASCACWSRFSATCTHLYPKNRVHFWA